MLLKKTLSVRQTSWNIFKNLKNKIGWLNEPHVWVRASKLGVCLK